MLMIRVSVDIVNRKKNQVYIIENFVIDIVCFIAYNIYYKDDIICFKTNING